jgi:hypothetical protein
MALLLDFLLCRWTGWKLNMHYSIIFSSLVLICIFLNAQIFGKFWCIILTLFDLFCLLICFDHHSLSVDPFSLCNLIGDKFGTVIVVSQFFLCFISYPIHCISSVIKFINLEALCTDRKTVAYIQYTLEPFVKRQKDKININAYKTWSYLYLIFL